MAAPTAPAHYPRETNVLQEQRRARELYQRATDAILAKCQQEPGPWNTHQLVSELAASTGMSNVDIRKGLLRLVSHDLLRFSSDMTEIQRDLM